MSIDAFVHDRQRMLDSLVDNLAGLVYCNLYDEHWTMIYVSQGCQDLTGYSPDALVFNQHISFAAMIYSEDCDWVRQKIDEAVQRNQGFEVECRIIHASGEVIWVCERSYRIYNAQDEVHALEGLIQNITARKLIEQSLRDTEFRYRSIF